MILKRTSVEAGTRENPGPDPLSENRCIVCDEVNSNRLICAQKHVACNACFSKYIKITWIMKANLPLGESPQVRCVHETCTAPPFSSQEIAKHADPEAWASYEEQVGKFKEASAIARIQQEMEQNLARQRNATVTTTTTTTTTTATTDSQTTPAPNLDQTQPANDPAPLIKAKRELNYVLGQQLLLQLRDPKMCPRCRVGPIEIWGCPNLMAHHGEMRARGPMTDNSCHCCGYFSETASDWLPWDGVIRDAESSTWKGMTKKRKIELISQAFECDAENAQKVLIAGQSQLANGRRPRARLADIRARMRERVPLPSVPPLPHVQGPQLQRNPYLSRGFPVTFPALHPPAPVSMPVFPIQRGDPIPPQRPRCLCSNCRSNGTTTNLTNDLFSIAQPSEPPVHLDYSDYLDNLMLGPLESDLQDIGDLSNLRHPFDLDDLPAPAIPFSVRMNRTPAAIRGATTTTTTTTRATTSRVPTLPPTGRTPLRSNSIMISSPDQPELDPNPQIQVEETIDAGITSWRFHAGQRALECSRQGLTITLFRNNLNFEVTDGSGTRSQFLCNIRGMRVDIPQERRPPIQAEGWMTNVPVTFGDWNIAAGVDDIILFNKRHECVINLAETFFSADSHAT